METHECRGGVGVLVALLHAFGIILYRLPLVSGVKIKGVDVLDWLEVSTFVGLLGCYQEWVSRNRSYLTVTLTRVEGRH